VLKTSFKAKLFTDLNKQTDKRRVKHYLLGGSNNKNDNIRCSKNSDDITRVHRNNWHTSMWVVVSRVIDFISFTYNTNASTSLAPSYLSIYNKRCFLSADCSGSQQQT